MNTLFDITNISGRVLIGKELEIILHENNIEIFSYNKFIEKKSIKTNFDKRLAVVQLVNNYDAIKSRIADVFGISRQSINNWLDNFEKSGPLGLINNTKDSWKTNPHRFTGNKNRQLEQDRLVEKELKDEQKMKQEPTINFEETPTAAVPIKSELYTDDYCFEDNRYAGGMLIMGMLEHLYGFHDITAQYYEEHLSFLFLFVGMHIFQVDSIEQLKVIHKPEFGRIIGRKKLPSLPYIWTEVHKGVDMNKSANIQDAIFNYQALHGLVALDYLSLDGHFIPYYGNEKTHKGYFTQRDLMMKGQTQMFLHDASGRIVYFDTQEGKGDIVTTLKSMSEFICKINTGEKPLIAVDREIWGVENFIYLSKERIVTWEKFRKSDELQKIDIKSFKEEIKKSGHLWKLYEDKKEYEDSEKKNKITLRRIIFHNVATGKRLSAVTTDNQEKMTLIAEAMLSRWGANENSFKYMGERTNMHYNPVIDIVKESENQNINNPEFKEIHKELTQTKRKLTKAEIKLGRIPTSVNIDDKLRKNKHRDNLKAKILKLKQEIETISEQLKNIPERIDIEKIGDEKFKVINNEGVDIWGLCQTVFWNSRKELVERFAQYLPNHRDTIPVLEALINAPGRIRSTPLSILVKLETLDTPRFKSAQIQLLRYMNNLKIKINGKLLQFDTMSK